MFGFLMGMVLGAIGGAAYGSRYFRDSDLQTQFNDTQDRLTNLMGEVRTVLDETRVELRQAWEKTRDSASEKAERIQGAIGEGTPGPLASGNSASASGTAGNSGTTPKSGGATGTTGFSASGGSKPKSAE